ncbi:hypothetical protein [Desulfosporosinus sp. OT]|uniref:hypothetical protein n=1 Tax=Desulfosporosinus sp. OT TaxID=913865 RepID=UPI001FA76CAB|nr:hypothetical protein [Desulfosporosinus sp. OT]
MKKDRFVAGGIAGFGASITCDSIGILYKSLGWTDRAFNDTQQFYLRIKFTLSKGFSV